MPFEKGHKYGNRFSKDNQPPKNGRKPKLPALDVLLADVLGEEKDGIEAAKAVLMALRKKAISGDVRAAEALMNRAYGMPKQNIVGTNINISEESMTMKQAKDLAKKLLDDH